MADRDVPQPKADEREAEPLPFRLRLRTELFTALSRGDYDKARSLGEYLARLTPAAADDLAVVATTRVCCGDTDGARALLLRALALDPFHLTTAKGLFNLGVASDAVIAALSWHAETDTDAIRLLMEQVRRTGTPLPYVAGRMVHCILPPTAGRVSMHWQGLTLADQSLSTSGDAVRVVAFRVPEPLRGVIDPVVMVDAVAAGPAIRAAWLRPPRLTGLVERLDAERWQARVLDLATPARPVAVLLLDGQRLLSRHVSVPPGGEPIIDLLDAPLLSIPLPAGGGQPRLMFELTGEPLLLPEGTRVGGPAGADGVVDVIVPVYGDEAATRACFAALLGADAGLPMRVIAIDDAGPIPALSAFLDTLAATGKIVLRRNPGNLGFVRSVNAGMAMSADRDVVLLNADTVVSTGWLRRLHAAAYRTADTGTVTPWSNDATICSYPTGNDRTPLDQVDPVGLDSVAQVVFAGQTVPIPTAVGFCMYIRRDCLNQTGWFDAVTFGAGYGEENDFCLRATAHGWRHVMALDTYVGHVGGGSFGPEKRARIRDALSILEQRHPGYDAEIQHFLAADPVAAARRRFDLARLTGEARVFPLLLVCAALGGGTERFISTLVARHAAAGVPALILRPERASDGRRTMRLEVPNRPDLPNLVYDLRDGFDDLHAELKRLGVERMEIHHPFHLDLPALSRLAGWFPYRVHLHDYSWICPRITLTGADDVYCGEPDVAICEKCVTDNGDLLGIDLPVARWREGARAVLEGASAVDCATMDSARRITRYAPAARVRVTAIEDVPIPASDRTARVGRNGEPWRVLVPGAIGPPKGFSLLLACARDAAARDLPLRFVVMGYTLDDAALFETGRVQITGLYEEPEAPALLAGLQPHVGFLPSTWPETWCYALTHLFAAGLPVAAFDLGAQGERVRKHGKGILLPLTMTPSAINDQLITLASAAQ